MGTSRFILLAGLMAIAINAEAAQITVTTLLDENDTGPDCSLREALQAANDNIPFGGCSTGGIGVDQINIAVEGTIFLSTSNDHIEVIGSVNISAQNLTIAAADNKRIFFVESGILEVSGIEFINGRAPVTGEFEFQRKGGALYVGEDGEAIITDCEFRNNYARSAGGAIYVGGRTTITRTIVENNKAEQGSGLFANQADLNVFESVIKGNSEIFSNNGNGGGIWCSGSSATLIVDKTEISDNKSGVGGGLLTSDCSTLMTNSTISGNEGGGGWFGVGPTEIYNTTITENSTSSGVAGLDLSNPPHTIFSSIVAGNHGVDYGAFTISLGNNHFGSITSWTTGVTNGVNNDRVGIGPRLRPLDSNGGFAKSHMPMPGSPVIDSGSCASSGISQDQRLLPRAVDIEYNDGTDPLNVGDGCDVGSVEVQQSEIPDYQMDLTAFLHGPYDRGLMNDAGSPSTAVDTVIVQVRNPSNRGDVLVSRQGIIMGDGSIKGLDDAPSFVMNGFASGLNHISIDHRNHLAIMTKDPINIDATGMSFDFTVSLNQAYGTTPMIQLADGFFALWGGDGDQNEAVTSFDFLEVWLPQNGTSPGYHQGDFNLDGVVTAFDFVRVWLPANGKASQIP